MSSYSSSHFKFKPEFISLVKSSSLKCIEHKDEVFPGAHPHLPPLQHKIDPFLSPPQSLRACGAKECLFHSLRLWCFHISLRHIFPAFSRNVQKYRVLFSVRSSERLKSRVPESTSQLLLNREETNANGGPKWRQIWTSYIIHKKFAFYANRKIFSLKFLGGCLVSYKRIKKISIRAL